MLWSLDGKICHSFNNSIFSVFFQEIEALLLPKKNFLLKYASRWEIEEVKFLFFLKKISNILMLKMCWMNGYSFSDLPSAILAKLNSATTFLASVTLYIYNNIIIIFQFKTKVKFTENRSAVRWKVTNRPWFVAWSDGDGSKGEVQNKVDTPLIMFG